MKTQVNVTIDDETIEWVEKMIDEDERFSSLSHAIRYGLKQLKKEEERKDTEVKGND